MKISEIIKHVKVNEIIGDTEKDITHIAINSAETQADGLFIAVKGTKTDGHTYIYNAVKQGATAILCVTKPEKIEPHVTYVMTDDSEGAAGVAASAFYGEPSKKLKLVGVTGTNGKTTTATLLYKLFGKLGYRCSLLSTVANYIMDRKIPAMHTTPDPISLNRLLAEMVAEGCEYAFMECSSHAIAQQRIAGQKFAGGIFTNLTRDHLDYHGTLENYRDAKKLFFDKLSKSAFAIINADDKNGKYMVQNCKAKVMTYSIERGADFHALITDRHFDSTTIEIQNREVTVRFIGRFNVSNILAVYGAAMMLGQNAEETLLALSTLQSVSGRLEPVHGKNGVTAIVDYAHTPDALKNVLLTIHDLSCLKGQIITVCGAGGNRDKGKRPLMAQEAAKLSDRVILTSDNPRDEDPQAIIDDMLKGMSGTLKEKITTITDRREAIKTAIQEAQKDDIILIAGKGHEDYQEIKGVKHHFDDKEVAHEYLQ